MATMYKVVGHCAHATVEGPSGRVRQMFFKGQLLPPDIPESERNHLLSVKLIAPIEVAVQAQPAEQPTTVGTQATEPAQQVPTATDTGGDGQQDTGGGDADAEKQWAEAQAKAQALIESGSKPDGRSAPLTIAAFLVEKGYDRAAMEKAEKKDLLDLVNQVNQ